MNRHNDVVAAAIMPPDRQWAGCLNEKLAHRALCAPARPQAPLMSPEARDRLYARMFPTSICQGVDVNANPNSLA